MARFVVVGDGIAARMALYRLFRGIAEGFACKVPLDEVVQIADSALSPPASWRSTAHVGTHGIQKGVSPLGDVLLQACDETFSFFSQMSKAECLDWGVHRGEHWALAESSSEKEVSAFFRRYGRSENDGPCLELKNGEGLSLNRRVFSHGMSHLLFRPARFLAKLDREILRLQEQSGISFTRIAGHVEKIDRRCADYLSYQSGCFEELSLDASLVCSGAFQAMRQSKGQVRPGSFWILKGEVPPPFSELKVPLVLSRAGSVLTFRPQCLSSGLSAELLIGGTSYHSGQFVGVPWSELFDMWEQWKTMLDREDRWPSFSAGEVITGFRHHLPKRHPFCGSSVGGGGENLFFTQDCGLENNENNENNWHWEISGLYKNGYSLSFLGSRLLYEQILNT